MARLDVPLVFCGSMLYTVLLLLHLTSLTVSQSTADSSTIITIAPTSVYNGSSLLATNTEATSLFSLNSSSSASSYISGESISPSSSMFIDSISNSSIAISVDSSIDMSQYISSSSSMDVMESSNNPMETMSLSDNSMESSTPNMQSSSDIVTVTSTSVYNSNSNNQNSSSQSTAGSQHEMSIAQTTDIVETNSPMLSTGLNIMTSMYSTPPSIGSIESSAVNDLESSVSEYLTSSDSEVTSSIIATENPSLTSAGNTMTSTPIVDASSSVFINSVVSDMPSSSETPESSEIQSASGSVSSLGIVPSSTVIQTTSNSNIQVSSSVLPTTTTTSTKTPTPPTTTIPPSSTLADDIQSSIDGNSLFEVEAALDIFICVNITSDEDLREFVQDEVLKNVDAIRNVVVVKNGCPAKTRRKRAANHLSKVKISVDANIAANDPTKVANEISLAFQSNTESNITDTNFLKYAASKFNDSCNAGVCDKLYGYMCTRINSTHGTCTSRCKDETCSNHGTCSTIVTDSNVFGHRCSCNSEEYYKYEGDDCDIRHMKWELAVAIAAGSGGAVILILVFVLIICCCCKNKGDKYGYDRRHSYEPMSDVIGRSGPAYYRNDSKNQQPVSGFTNLGYDDDKYSDYSDPSQTRPPNGQSWNPEDSKDTYAKITEQLDQEKRFEIKRPQVSGSIRQNSSAEATTGF